MKVKCRLFLVISLVGLMATPILSCAPTVSPAPAPEPTPPEEEIQVEEPGQTVVEAQALQRYEFATEGLEIWKEMQAITVGAFEVFSALDEQIPCHAEVTNLVNRHYQLEHRLKWLYAPHDTLEIKTSLLDDADLIGDCVARLVAACQFRDEGDQVAYQRYSREVVELFVDFFGEKRVPSEETEVKLINLKLQAEKDLKLK